VKCAAQIGFFGSAETVNCKRHSTTKTVRANIFIIIVIIIL